MSTDNSHATHHNAFTFLVKQLVENPLAFISLVALGGIVYLYQDMKEFMMAQTTAFQEFTVALKEQNLRIQHLEQYHLEQMRRDGTRKPTTDTDTPTTTTTIHNER